MTNYLEIEKKDKIKTFPIKNLFKLKIKIINKHNIAFSNENEFEEIFYGDDIYYMSFSIHARSE